MDTTQLIDPISSLAVAPLPYYNAWREVLIPYLCEDTCLVALWKCSTIMQQLIRDRTEYLVCRFRPVDALHKRPCAFPSFITQLNKLRHLKLLPSSITMPHNMFLKLRPDIPWNLLPTTVTSIDLPQLDLQEIPESEINWTALVDQYPNEIVDLFYNRPELSLTGCRNPASQRRYRNFQLQLLLRISKQFKPLASLSYFIYVDDLVLIRIMDIYSNGTEAEQQWMREYWFPHIQQLKFENSLGRVVGVDIELWAYQHFPNVTRIIGGNILPLDTITEYYSLKHKGVAFADTIHTFSRLTCVSMLVDLDKLPSILPGMLKRCYIEVKRSNTHHDADTQADMTSLLNLVPPRLKTLSLLSNSNQRISWYWTPEMVSLLPRSLRDLRTSSLSTDHSIWKELPPLLTTLDVPEITTTSMPREKHYMMLPTGITHFQIEFMYSGYQTEQDRAMGNGLVRPQILTNFTSLTSLNIVLTDISVFIRGFSDFPESLLQINIRLRNAWDSSDVITYSDGFRSLVFPKFLKELSITGNNTSIDGKFWQPLPNSLTSLSLTNLNIMSLPLRWPVNLQYLHLHNTTTPTTYSSIIKAATELNGILLMTNMDSYQAKVDFTRNINSSMLHTPTQCLIHESHGGDNEILLINRTQKSFEIRKVF